MTGSASIEQNNGLHEPLLSRPVLGDEETLVAMEESVILQRCAAEEVEPDDRHFGWCDSLVIWLVLPGLLWLDFCLAFWTNPETNCSLRFGVVNVAFVLFMVSSCLYRKMMEDLETGHAVVVLLPEIAMNAVLALILANKIVAAFLLLLSSILLLSSVVVVNSLFILCSTDSNNADDDNEEQDEASVAVVAHPRRVRWSRDLERQDFHAERFL